MKRFLAFIMVIIVAVAAFTPCCNIDDCQGDLIEKQDISNRAGTEGTCSPFFSCATCSGFTISAKYITVSALAEIQPQYFESHTTFLSSTYATSPWQPPRFV